MPRAKLEAAFLGRYTLSALDTAPDAAFLWLGHALFAWILRDELPEEVPPEHAVAWNIIQEESKTIHESRKRDIDNGGLGGRPPKPKDEKGNPRKPKETQVPEKETKIKIESKSKSNTPAVAGEVREAHPARAREAWEPCEDCPAPEANVRATARHIGMPDAELQSWRDYWTMREWRADPRSARPMTPAGVLASLRRWHAEEGIRAAKQAHLDAKADERALAVAAARDERRAPAVTDYDAIERAKELAWARSPVVNLDELDKLAGTAKKEA